ncbi:DJ-1/PfpI family protein [Muricauda sp. ANG21]|uniref:DJ-1/PfpI family protein n=1 Tax=Allomuricauda sp. ANG21 TaxID=3042468 RepID=UPI003457087D
MNKSIFLLATCLVTLCSLAQNSIPMESTYICPPCGASCDETEHDSPGVCSHCNMVLIKKSDLKTIAFYLQDGVEVLDFAGPMEVFAYAGYKVFTVSATQQPIKSQGILTVTPDYSVDNAPNADILAFFGGNSGAASQNPKVIDWVQRQKNIQYHFSVCTGAFVLAEAGILNGQTATTFHNALDDLEKNYPKINVRKNVRFVDNGKVITTAGISAGIDGALHLVAKLQGLNAAKRTAYYMEYDNWNLGNGLILSDDNPYTKRKTDAFFKNFEGSYKYKNNTEFNLTFNKREGNLEAKINGVSYPVYHEKDDIFSDVRNEPVFFQRNEADVIIGYKLSQEGELFQKL